MKRLATNPAMIASFGDQWNFMEINIRRSDRYATNILEHLTRRRHSACRSKERRRERPLGAAAEPSRNHFRLTSLGRWIDDKRASECPTGGCSCVGSYSASCWGSFLTRGDRINHQKLRGLRPAEDERCRLRSSARLASRS